MIRATIFARDMSVHSIITIPNVDDQFNTLGVSVAELTSDIQKISKSAARRLIEGGGISVNNVKVVDPNARIKQEQGENQWEFILYELV
jgi:tyrosyl-tRNA synthetase